MSTFVDINTDAILLQLLGAFYDIGKSAEYLTEWTCFRSLHWEQIQDFWREYFDRLIECHSCKVISEQ